MKPLHIPLVCLVALCATENSTFAQFDPAIVLHGGKVIASPGQTLDDAAIVLKKGRIVTVGRNIDIPTDAVQIDVSGLFVYPGFIDGATHAGIMRDEPTEEQLQRLEDENPDVREGPQSATVQANRRLMHPHWRAEELFDPAAAKLEDFRRLGFTAGLVAPKIAIFSGTSAVIEFGDVPLRRSILVSDFAQHAAFTTGIVPDGMPRRGRRDMGEPKYPTTTIGAIAAFRQIMLDAMWYRDLRTWSLDHPKEERSPLDRDLEALIPCFDYGKQIVFLANSENEIHRALNVAAEFKLRPIIAGAREAWKLTDRLKAEKAALIVSLKWSKEPEYKPDEDRATPPTTMPAELRPVFDEKWGDQPFEPRRLFEERVRLWHEEVDNCKHLHEAGIPFAIGSFEMKELDDLMKNLRTAIERGLPEDAALGALTQDAAELFGLSGQVGRIEPGALANLAIFDRPFSEDKARAVFAFVEGKRFDLSLMPKKRDRKGEDRKGRSEKDKTASAPSEDASSQPTTSSTSQPTSRPVEFPEFACEIEADRKPPLQTGGTVLLKNANLLTITNGDILGADLLIENGRIAGVGGTIPPPPGAKVIDLTGYCVMPGIFDPHSHICTDGGLNEASRSVTPEVRIRDVIDNRDVSAYRALAGGVTMVHTMHGSANTIGGQNAVIHLKYGRPTSEWLFAIAPRTVKFALGENVKQSNWGNKGTRFPNTRMGVEATIRRSFDAALRDQAEKKTYAEEKAAGKDPRPLRRDLRLEALADILNGDIRINSHCYRADEILRLLAVTEDYGVRIAVLHHILEGYRVIPELRRHGCGASTFSDWWGYKLEAYDATPFNAARMIQGGVVATINSDSPEMGRHLNWEAAKSLRYGGLSPNECLQMITINSALQFDIADEVGSLEVGKLGDIAVFDGHPLDSFSKCVLTLIEGEVFFQHPSLDVQTPATPLAPRTFPAPRPPLQIPPSPDHAYWITGATVHPVAGDVIPTGTVVIKNGRIDHVGPSAGDSPPEGTISIDATGLHVYPGLVNASSNLGLMEISSVAGSVDQTEIGEFQSDISALSAYNPFASAVGITRTEGITAALIVPGGAVIAGQSGLVQLNGWSMPETQIASPLGLVLSLPSLPERFPDELPDEKKREQIDEHRKVMSRIEEFFRKARHYADTRKDVHSASATDKQFDRRLEAMIPYMRGDRPVLLRADSYKQIREVLQFAEHFKLRPILLGGRESWKIADELAAKHIDVILGRTTEYPATPNEPWDSVYRCPAILESAGVRFCISVEDPTLGKLLGVELGYARAHGLNGQIELITLRPAEILGVADQIGSLEVGKRADLMICTDSPMQASNCVVGLFINGQPVDLANRQTLFDAQFQSRPEPPLPPEPTLRGSPALRLPVQDRG